MVFGFAGRSRTRIGRLGRLFLVLAMMLFLAGLPTIGALGVFHIVSADVARLFGLTAFVTLWLCVAGGWTLVWLDRRRSNRA